MNHDEDIAPIFTEDGVEVTEGDRAFNYYDHKAGTIGHIDFDNWFTFIHDDGTKASLNGQRLCSIAYATRQGWIS